MCLGSVFRACRWQSETARLEKRRYRKVFGAGPKSRWGKGGTALWTNYARLGKWRGPQTAIPLYGFRTIRPEVLITTTPSGRIDLR
ncbi:MAG: hypothetical protein QOJ99_604 [Bryobacterales bacterium]|jgi:hypothetical protein|nr:hypothetical protein [Bryobacterales bacterium]